MVKYYLVIYSSLWTLTIESGRFSGPYVLPHSLHFQNHFFTYPANWWTYPTNVKNSWHQLLPYRNIFRNRSIVGTSACYRLSLQALFIFCLGIALYIFSESWISDPNFGSQQVSVNQWFDSVLIYISTSAISVSDITTAKSSQIKSRASLLSITMNMRTDCI